MQLKIALDNNLELTFDIEKSPIAELWLDCMRQRVTWPMDDPNRFYGFDDTDTELARAEKYICERIGVINRYQHIIKKPFTNCFDQDRLNYYHNIFEQYHGQLDQQGHEFWQHAPNNVRQALSELNLAVHRCETATRPTRPRFVCTWYGMPKINQLDLSMQKQYGVEGTEFGAVYLNYCEIGKMIKEMAMDNDQYMADEMFKPFDFYSADFVVTFYDETPGQIIQTRSLIEQYYFKHRNFFTKYGITGIDDVRIRPLRFKVAQLSYELHDKSSIIKQIRDNQQVSSVIIQ